MPINDVEFGLCSSEIATHIAAGSRLNYESLALLEEAKKVFDGVIEIHPWRVSYRFIRGKEKPQLLMEDRDISGLSCLAVRGTGGYEQAISVLVRGLRLCGCIVLDPADRFSGETASKLLTNIDRYEKTVGSDSYYAFSLVQALALMNELSQAGAFPLLTKPITGKRGKDVIVLTSKEEAEAFVRKYFQKEEAKDTPLFVQPYVEYVSEYRVMLVGDRFIGIAQKHKRDAEIAANAALGGVFAPADDPDIIKFVMENVNLEGILGVDVARDTEGKLHIIEANRAPLWKEFERATGINVAKEIVHYARQKCD